MTTTRTLDVIVPTRVTDEPDLQIFELDRMSATESSMISFTHHTSGLEPISFSKHTSVDLPLGDNALTV